MLKCKQSKESGFTLIEVLIVLVILGILMAISFVFLGDQGKRARLATATSSVKSAMTIVATCRTMGFDIFPAPDEAQGPSTKLICNGNIAGSAVWPELPEDCQYCGMVGNIVSFHCKKNTTCDDPDVTPSYCNFDTTQCTQNE